MAGVVFNEGAGSIVGGKQRFNLSRQRFITGALRFYKIRAFGEWAICRRMEDRFNLGPSLGVHDRVVSKIIAKVMTQVRMLISCGSSPLP